MEDYQVSMLNHDPMCIYRAKRDRAIAEKSVNKTYTILGFISSGTYGRVYKAKHNADGSIHAIKKFKPDKEGDVITYTGLSQSAVREIALNRELSHPNIVSLSQVLLEEKSIYMVFAYAEHDFLQLIHHHSQTIRTSIPTALLKSLTFQLLNGLVYLHSCHILHRDLKPANILITSQGQVKIGDLGLARIVYAPLQPLFAGDKVVVTIWYRAPELLMGAKHYNKAIDIWAVGCVLAELAALRPIFKGEEAKLDSKKNVPFQRDQLIKIFDVLGTPDERDWPGIVDMPEYSNMKRLDRFSSRLTEWAQTRLRSAQAYDLLRKLFCYDPEQRLTAKEALQHRWFQEDPLPTANAFQNTPQHQLPPHRKITQDEGSGNGMMAVTQTQTQSFPQIPHGPGAPAPPFTQRSDGSMSQTSGPTARSHVHPTHQHQTRKKARIG